jgi:hypothetical protein
VTALVAVPYPAEVTVKSGLVPLTLTIEELLVATKVPEKPGSFAVKVCDPPSGPGVNDNDDGVSVIGPATTLAESNALLPFVSVIVNEVEPLPTALTENPPDLFALICAMLLLGLDVKLPL